MGFPKTFRMVEYNQQLVYILNFDLDRIKSALDDWQALNKYAFIVHDLDKREDGVTPKDPHIHIMLYFGNPYPTNQILSFFEKLFGVSSKGDNSNFSPERLEKIKGGWSSAIAYLTHANAPGKHQYDQSSVIANFDITEDTEIGKAKHKDLRLAEILAAIDNETIRQFNITDHVTIEEMARYKNQIDIGFKYVYTRKAKECNRIMDVMYISGKSGTGKTTFAKWYCEQYNMSYIVSSSSNDPMQDYTGQDCLILDDFRPGDWKMADLLKLLDNHTISSVKSRYSNKYMCYCKMIIITSVVPLDDVWDNLNGDFKEPKEQLLRRITISADCDAKQLRLKVGNDVYYVDNPSIKFQDSMSVRRAEIGADLVKLGAQRAPQQLKMTFELSDKNDEFV